jgi:UDPglucose--hexose-1-phosphate uridylyltransferase
VTLDPPTQEELDECPFCEGREDRTPPETYALGPSGRAPDTPGWRVRVVPNLYPAFERQEVVIHTPRHARSIAELSPYEIYAVATAWQARARSVRAEDGSYLHAFINEGREAGASLPHTHSQLVWLKERPPVVEGELHRWESRGCGVCRLVAGELGQAERIVAQRNGLIALCPYASRTPYELLVAPVTHEADVWSSPLLGVALELVGDALRRLHAVEGPRPVNAWLHTEGHWHLEVLPRFGVLAGIELGAGVYVNPMPPEEAAAALRGARA